MRKAIYLSLLLRFARRVIRKASPGNKEAKPVSPGDIPLPASGTYGLFLVDHCESPVYYLYGNKFKVPDDENSRMTLYVLMRLIKGKYCSERTHVGFSVEILPSDGPEDYVGMYPAWTQHYEQHDKVMTEAYGHVMDTIPPEWFLD